MPVWTLASASVEPLSLDLPKDSGVVGPWRPGLHETPVGQGARAFACRECWKVREVSLLSSDGWNLFVTYLSGGLLYGHEVVRPMEEAPAVRMREFRPRRRAAPKCEMMLERVAAGLRPSEIALEFGVTRQAVENQMRRARKARGAENNAALTAMLRAGRAAEAAKEPVRKRA